MEIKSGRQGVIMAPAASIPVLRKNCRRFIPDFFMSAPYKRLPSQSDDIPGRRKVSRTHSPASPP